MGRLLLVVLLLAITVQGHWWWREGIRRKNGEGFALRFNDRNPTTQFVEFTKPITFGSPAGISFEFQVRPRAVTLSQQPFLDFRDNSGNYVTFSIDLLQRVVVTVKKPSKSSTSVASNLLSLAFDTWNYMIVTIDRNGVVRFYSEYNKVVTGFGSGSLSYPIPSFTATTNSAGRIGNDNDFFTGDLDEIRIWTTILPNSEFNRYRIIDLTPNSFADLLLLHWWTFDDAIGDSAYDTTKNGNTGLLGGGNVARFPDWIFTNPVPSDTCRNIQTRSSFSIRTWDTAPFNNILATGEYWFALSPPEKEGIHAIAIQVKLDRTTISPTSIIGVAFDYYGDDIWLDFNFPNNGYSSILKIREDGQATYRTEQTDAILLDSGITIVRDGPKADKHTITIEVPFSLILVATVDPRSNQQKVEIEVRISRDEFASRSPIYMSGLCGNYDLVKSNDVIDLNAAKVLPQDSLFSGNYFYLNYTGPNIFDCDVNRLQTSIKNQAYNVCRDSGLVSADYTDDCLREVCTTGEIESAVTFARATYRDCVQAFASRSNVTTNNCPKICPNFCNFQGNCRTDATCACFNGYGGVDCSQKAQFPCYNAKWSGSGIQKTLNPVVGNPNTDIVAHYSYGNPNDASANTGNEISESVVIYLYQQPNAMNISQSKLGLVLLADKAQDGTGGSMRVVSYFSNEVNNVAIAVKDDPSSDHFYSLNNNVFTGDWTWWRCCTDGIAFKGLPSSGSFCVRFNFTRIEGITQIVVSQPNQFASQDLFGVATNSDFSAASQLSICGDTCLNPCGILSDCTSCTANPKCGWCSETNACEFGSATGPDNGRCPTWRYSNLQNTSSVATTDVGFPVDPSEITAYVAPNNPLDVSFFVNFPQPYEVPLEIVLLQDVSSAFLALGAVKAQTVYIYSQIQRTYIQAKLGISSFSDSPAFGTPIDFAYKTNLPLTAEKGAIQDTLNSLQLFNGGAAPNSQFEALSRVSTASDVRWTPNSRRVVIILTFSPARIDTTYTSDRVKNDLLTANIIPVFLAPAAVVNQYSQLVSSWGFGYVRTVSTSDYTTIFSEISTILNTISGSAKAIIQTAGPISSITPSSGYSGLSPLTRVTFNARLTSAGSGNAVIVIPGYGKVNILPAQSPNPSTPSSQTVLLNLASGTTIDIQLQGSSTQSNPLSTVITRLPSHPGTLFQKGGLIPINSVGTVVTDPGLRVTYIAPSNANGSPYDSFDYKLQDSCGACSLSTTVFINVNGVFPKPVAVPNPPSITVLEDGSASVTLRGNGTFNFAQVTRLPTQGQLLYNSAAVTLTTQILSPYGVTYVPSPNFYGADLFAFTVASSQATSDEVVVPITVTAVNDPPTANAQTVSTPEDTPLVITLTGTPGPMETEAITFRIVSQPANGALTRLSEGVYRFSSTLYWNGVTSFTFYTNDGQYNSSIATVTVTVTPVDNQPIATSLRYSIDQDTAYTINLNGTDVDTPGAPVIAFICDWNGRGTLKLANGTVIQPGSSYIDLINNVVIYQSPLNQYGASFTSFTYGVKKAASQTSRSDCVTVTISVNKVYYAPTLPTPPVVSLFQGTTIPITLVGNDANSDFLQFIICGVPSRGTLTQIGGGNIGFGGSITTRTQNGQSTSATLNYFVATAGADTFSFYVSDGNLTSSCTTVNINVSSVNHPPIATPPSPVTVLEDSQGVSILLGGSDPDGDTITYFISCLPTKGSLYQTGGTGNYTTRITNINTQTTQRVFYIPTSLTFGNDSFGFTTYDGSLTSNQAIVSITINHVNHKPTAFNADFTLNEDTYIDFNVTGSDIDVGDILSFTIVSGPTQGTLSPSGTFAFGTTLRYTPPPNYNNIYPVQLTPFASFSFVASDGQTNSSVAIVTFSVLPVNDAPTAAPESANVTTIENTPIQLKLSGSDIDNDPLTIMVTSIPKGRLFQSLGEGITQNLGAEILVNGIVTNTPSGRVVYVPGSNDNTRPYAIIQYSVSDGQAVASASVTINLQPLPQGLTTSASGNEDSPVTIQLASSYPSNNNFTITSISEGSITLSDGVTSFGVGSSVFASGSSLTIKYTGPQYGNGVKTFQYTVTSGGLTSSPTTVSVTLAPVPSPLFITQTTITVNEDFSGVIPLPIFDPDNSQTTTVTINGLPLFVTIYNVGSDNSTKGAQIAGSNRAVTNRNWLVFFQLDPNAFGQATMSLDVEDSSRPGAQRSVTIVINPVNDLTIPQSTAYVGSTDADLFVSTPLSWTNPDNFGGFIENQLVKFSNIPPASKGVLQYQAPASSTWINITSGQLIPATISNQFNLQFVPGPRICLETGTAPPCAHGDSYSPYGDPLNNYLYTSFTWSICDSDYSSPAFGNSTCDPGTESSSQTNTIQIVPTPKPPVPIQQIYPTNTVNVYSVGTAILFTLQASLPDCIRLNASGATPADIAACYLDFNFLFAGTGIPSTSAGISLTPTGAPFVTSATGSTFNAASATTSTASNGIVTQNFYYRSSGIEETVTLTYKTRTKSTDVRSSAYFITIVIQQNDPPIVTSQSQAPHSVDGRISTTLITDDATSTQQLKVDVYLQTTEDRKAQQMSLYDDSGLSASTYVFNDNPPYGFTLFGTLQVLNNLLGANNGIAYPAMNDAGSTIIIFVNDQGAGLVPQDQTKAKNATKTILLDDGAFNALGFTGAGAASLVGVTTLTSMGTFGVFQLLKKKKVIPEEADPWENDELWDATLDNPLFPGGKGEAIY